MELAVLVPSLQGGGAETAASLWTRQLAGTGHRVHVVCYDRPAITTDAVIAHWIGGSGKAARGPRLPRLARSLADVLPETVEAVISILTYSNLVALASRRAGWLRKPVVATEHTIPSLLLRGEGMSGIAKHRLAQLLYPAADAVTGPSHAAVMDLRSSYSVREDRAFFLPNPVVTQSLKRRGRRTDGTVRVLFVGRVVAAKRLDLLVKAASVLRARGTDTRITICGDGPCADDVRALASELEVPLSMMGWMADWSSLGPSHDVFALPSATEGFGIVLIEAADLGLPAAVSSTALGAGDAFISGLTGVRAASSTAEGFADAIIRASNLGVVSAPRQWREQYDPTNSTLRLVGICEYAVNHAR